MILEALNEEWDKFYRACVGIFLFLGCIGNALQALPMARETGEFFYWFKLTCSFSLWIGGLWGWGEFFYVRRDYILGALYDYVLQFAI